MKIAAVLLDCGDTLIDEASEVKTDGEVSLRADLIPGAGQLVRELKRRGYRLGLVVDGPAKSFENNLSPYGLYELFEVRAISEEIGVKKPDPRIFRHALTGLNIDEKDHGRVVMVGNNLGRDVKGANTLGLISVWLDWSPRRHKVPRDESEVPRYSIKTPLELIDLLNRLEQPDQA